MSSHWYVVINVFNNRMNDDSEPKSAICSIHSVWLWVATNKQPQQWNLLDFIFHSLHSKWMIYQKEWKEKLIERTIFMVRMKSTKQPMINILRLCTFFQRSVNLFSPNSLCNRWSSQHFNFIRSIEYKIICISVF